MMKKLAAATVVLALCGMAEAAQQVQVDGHFRRDGTYVPPHYRTAPDSSRQNNWSSQGNVNPHTGERGTVNPYAPQMPSYPSFPVYQQPRYDSLQ